MKAIFLFLAFSILAFGEQMEIFISVNGAKLSAILEQNSSAVALYELLSKGEITIKAKDYGGFEKVGALPQSLIRNDEQINVKSGDLILYQGRNFVLSYGENSWSLTRLGRIENINENELKRLLGAGEVELKLSIK